MPEICGNLFWQFGGSTKIYFANTNEVWKVWSITLLKDDTRASSLSEKELKESNGSVKHLLESKTSNTEASSTEI